MAARCVECRGRMPKTETRRFCRGACYLRFPDGRERRQNQGVTPTITPGGDFYQ